MEINYFHTLEEAINEAKTQASYAYQIESCGLVGYQKSTKAYVYCAFDNLSPKPKESFVIDPYKQLSFLEKFMVVAVFHSHLSFDAQPSDGDKKMAAIACFPYLTYSVVSKNITLYIPPTLSKDGFLYKNGVKELKELIK